MRVYSKKMCEELKEAVNNESISLNIGFLLAKLPIEKQRELLQKAKETTAFLKEIGYHIW